MHSVPIQLSYNEIEQIFNGPTHFWKSHAIYIQNISHGKFCISKLKSHANPKKSLTQSANAHNHVIMPHFSLFHYEGSRAAEYLGVRLISMAIFHHRL